MATFEQFQDLEIRAGIVTKAEVFTRARNPALKVWVDFGNSIGIKTTSAQITVLYSPEDLPGKRVLGLLNIGTRNIAGFTSEFLLLGLTTDKGTVHLATYDHDEAKGARLA